MKEWQPADIPNTSDPSVQPAKFRFETTAPVHYSVSYHGDKSFDEWVASFGGMPADDLNTVQKVLDEKVRSLRILDCDETADNLERINANLTKMRARGDDNAAIATCVVQYLEEWVEEVLPPEAREEFDLDEAHEVILNAVVFDLADYYHTIQTLDRAGLPEEYLREIGERLVKDKHLELELESDEF